MYVYLESCHWKYTLVLQSVNGGHKEGKQIWKALNKPSPFTCWATKHTHCNIGLALNPDVTTSNYLSYLSLSFREDLMPSTTFFQRIRFWAAFAASCQVMFCAINSTMPSDVSALFLLLCKFQDIIWPVVLDGGFLWVCPVPVPQSDLYVHWFLSRSLNSSSFFILSGHWMLNMSLRQV